MHVLPNDPQWLKNAFADLGVSEKAGSLSHPRILEMFQKAGHPEVKNDETAWCSAAANCWIVEAFLKGTGSLMARSWLRYGKGCDLTKPLPRGAILIFPRGNNPLFGHVAFLVEERPDGTIYYIGGNQGNAVSILRSHKSRLIGARWPNTVGNSKTLQAGMVSMGSPPTAAALEKVSENSDQIAQALDMGKEAASTLSMVSTYGAIFFVVLSFTAIGYMMYRHYKRNIKNAD